MRTTAVAATTEWKQQDAEVAADQHRRHHDGPDTDRRTEGPPNETPAQALSDEAVSAELLVLGARGRWLRQAPTGSTAVELVKLTPARL